MKRSPMLILGLLVVGAIAHSLYYYTQLPDEVAVHFDIHVEPDNWSSKGAAIASYILIVVLMSALFAGLGPLLRKSDPKYINIPNKNYWLAPERRAESIQAMIDMMVWIGIATNVMLIGVFHLMFEANMRTPVGMSTGPLVGLIVGDLIATFVIMFLLVRRFKKTG